MLLLSNPLIGSQCHRCYRLGTRLRDLRTLAYGSYQSSAGAHYNSLNPNRPRSKNFESGTRLFRNCGKSTSFFLKIRTYSTKPSPDQPTTNPVTDSETEAIVKQSDMTIKKASGIHSDNPASLGHLHSHDSSSHSHEHSLFHSHTHQHNDLLSKGFLTNPAVRITWIGLVVNVLMAGAKGLGGVVFHSQALVADAIHSVSDTVADFLTLATVNVANKEGTFARFPLGYGKIESVGTFLVSGVLLVAGLTVGWSSLLQILEMFLPSNIYEYLQAFQVHSHSHFSNSSPDHSHSHDSMDVAERQLPDINAAWLALFSIGIKELLYQKTMKIAKKTNSSVLAANAWHHRVDSLTAGVAAITVTTGVIFGISWLDAIGGLLVSALIVNVGLKTLISASNELVDKGLNPKSEQYVNVKLIVDETTENVAKSNDLNLLVVEFSLLSAGARSNVIIKMASEGSPSLAKICAMEHELISVIKEKDKTVGKVFVEYIVKDSK